MKTNSTTPEPVLKYIKDQATTQTPADAKFIYRWTRPKVPPETPYLYQPGEGTLVRVASSA